MNTTIIRYKYVLEQNGVHALELLERVLGRRSLVAVEDLGRADDKVRKVEHVERNKRLVVQRRNACETKVQTQRMGTG